MIKYLIEIDNYLDFEHPLDVENPFSFNIKAISPSTKIFLVDYFKIDDKYIVKTLVEKSAESVVRSICNLYPNLVFSLNINFWKDDDCRLMLCKTCLRTLKKRDGLHSNAESTKKVDDFKRMYLEFLKSHDIGEENEIKLV